MKELQLSRGYTTLVDDDVYDSMHIFKWHAAVDRTNVYAERYDVVSNCLIRLHHILLIPEDGCIVDHIDGNSLNNQRHNLRSATTQQNQMNKRKSTGTSSQYKGVTRRKDKRKCSAQIGFNYKLRHLGYFDNEQDAAIAYNKAATELFGVYARLNIVKEVT